MTLDQWLTASGVTEDEFALAIGVSQPAVHRYRRRRRMPARSVMTRIFAETKEAVAPNDFYDLPAISSLGEALAGQNLTVGRSLSGQAPQSDDIGAEVAA